MGEFHEYFGKKDNGYAKDFLDNFKRFFEGDMEVEQYYYNWKES